jgi:hypothetical protein
MVLLFAPVVAWAIYDTGITARDYWDSVKRPLIAGVLGGAAGWVVKIGFHSTLPPLAILIFGLTFSFVVYAGVLLFFMGQKEVFTDLMSHLFQRNRALPAAS